MNFKIGDLSYKIVGFCKVFYFNVPLYLPGADS